MATLNWRTVTILLVTVGLIENVYSLQCISCRSDELSECSTLKFAPLGNLTVLPSVTCQATELECETRISSDGVTTRGCKAEQSSCTGNTCTSCTSDNCNGGIFPSDRRVCLQCSGPDCAQQQTAFACPNYAAVDSCYSVFSKDGKTTYRGCTSDARQTIGSSYCEDLRELCVKCSVNGCNTATPTIQDNPLSCVKCDSLSDPNCAKLNEQNATSCGLISHGHVDACFIHVSNGVLRRGCLSERFDFEQDCQENKNVCELCLGSNCNRRTVENESCFVCDAETDQGCGGESSVDSRYGFVQCPLALNRLGCFHYDDGGNDQKRGCVNSLSSYETSLCQSQGQFCKVCADSNCNNLARFQHCHECTSSDTLDCYSNVNKTDTIICRGYNDQCLVRISDNSVERQCVPPSTLEADVCKHPAQCELCGGQPNCNSLSVGADDFCYTCDSKDDPNCRDNLTDSMKTQCTFSVRSMGCFREEYEDGHVRRGCLNSIPPTEVAECQKEGSTCKTCSGAYCNEKIDFQRCRTCNSSDSSSCFRSPGSFPSVVCPGYLDQCYVHLENNTVVRGCMSAADSTIQTNCNASNSELCNTCDNQSNCNNQLIEGEFCFTCNAETDPGCIDNANFTMRTQCPLAVQQRGCYLFTDGAQDVKRGCVADLIQDEINMCRRQGNECKTCIGNDCNSKPTFQRCRACNSTQNVNCIRAGYAFASVTCRSYLDDCYTHVDRSNVVTRGCVSQSPATTATDCQSGNHDICETCSNANGCNDKVVDGEFCLTCSSENDPNCRTNANYTMRTQCPLSPSPMGCYLFNDGGDVVKRGCVADLIASEVDMCRSEGQFCKTCIGNDCNAKPTFQTCRTCNSSTSVNCIRSPGSFQSVVCPKYTDQCFVHVEDNIVTRGCLSQQGVKDEVVATCANGGNEMCRTCDSTGNCNNQIVDGEFCLTCDASSDEGCRENANFTMRTQCPLSVNPVGCYLFNDGGDVVKRGCVADIVPDEQEMCRRQGDFCKTCIGNDCNAKATFQRCRSCSSAQSVSCIRSPNSFASVVCKNYDDECFVHVENNIVTRGCLNETTVPAVTETCNGSSEMCETCSDSNSCNNRIVDGEFCLTCDSENDPNCRSNANFTMRTQCPLSPNPRGCYRFQEGDIVKRGCVADLIPEEQELCGGQGNTCKTCIGNDCNAKASFQYCRACNSTNSVNCIRSPNSFAAVMCTDYLDECYVHVENNIVSRGCLADAGPAVHKECDTGDGELCETCSNGSSCNNRVVDGEFCIACRSELDPNCRDALNFTMREQCPLSVNPRGCYTFDDTGDVQVRGCVASLTPDERQMCREEDLYCKTCRGNDCNAKPKFTSCVSCSSSNSVACIRSPNSFQTSVCRNYLDECVTHVFNDVITRGCRDQIMNQQVQDDCAKGAVKDDFCSTCSETEKCNNNIVDGEFCLECDSTNDPNCLASTNHTMRVQCPLAVRQRGCYRFDDVDSVKRGCVASILPEEIEMCRREGDTCKTCIGNDCNQKPGFQHCRSCSSTNSVNCIRSPNSFAAITCKDYLDTCYTHVEDNVITRGCLAAATTSVSATDRCNGPNSEFCHTCTNDNCNNQIVDGEFCLTCDSATDPNCISNANFTMRTQCQLSAQPKGCYLFNDGAGDVKRGCLSDISTDEVNMCRRQGSECKTCIGNDCNSKPTFQSCRVCNSSTNVNCIRSPGSFASQVCRNYLDECFVHVENDVVTRGCLATTTANVIETCDTNPDLCSKCSSGPNCNNRIVDGEFCLNCDSETDPNCREKPDFTIRKQCPLAVQPRGCYLFNDGGDTVKRGCVADIVPDEIAMCRQQRNFCKTCIGNDCNQKVSFQQCKVCNSTTNVDCIRSAANYIGSQTCAQYTDKCFVHVRNNTITRGCLAPNPTLTEDCTDPNVCETCEDRASCNDKIVDGEFCITCSSSTDYKCRDSLDYTLRTQCSLAVTPLGCFHREIAGNNVERGCLSDLDAPQQIACHNSTTENCKVCLGNDCNTLATLPSCVVCDSLTDDNCVSPKADAASKTCDAYGDQCFTHIDGDRVRRGCLLEVDVNVADQCSNNGTQCEVCSEGAACNRRSVDQEFCFECNSQNGDCSTSVLESSLKACTETGYGFDRKGCYRWETNGIVTRGCVKDLPESSQAVCNFQGECKTCTDNRCNEKTTFQSCYQCDSETDPNCVSGTSGTDTQCTVYTDTCKTMIAAGGKTVRGCSSDLDKIFGSDIFSECVDNNCNGGVYPQNRRKCHQCSGSGCDQQLQDNASTLKYCSYYIPDDLCYGFIDENGLMNRGCHSDRDSNHLKCNELGSNCHNCSGSDGCNNQAQYRESALSCIQCAGTEECDWGYQAANATICKKPVGYGLSESCYTHAYATGVTRGCRLELEADNCPSGTDCSYCTGNGCNRYNVVTQSCQNCVSTNANQEVCSEKDVFVYQASCGLPNAIIEFRDRGCFTRNDTLVITRGCLNELSAEDWAKCADDEYTACEVCFEDNCNTKAPPSSSSALQALSVVVLCGLALFVNQFV